MLDFTLTLCFVTEYHARVLNAADIIFTLLSSLLLFDCNIVRQADVRDAVNESAHYCVVFVLGLKS